MSLRSEARSWLEQNVKSVEQKYGDETGKQYKKFVDTTKMALKSEECREIRTVSNISLHRDLF